MADERIWTAALLVIGDEILSGRTQDRNVAQIAAWLNLQGIRLAEVRVVPDDHAPDRRGGERASHRATTICSPPAASARPMTTSPSMRSPRRSACRSMVHPKARAIAGGYYATRGGVTEARLRMARVPEGAELIENRLSGRPGHPPRQHLHPRRRAAYRGA